VGHLPKISDDELVKRAQTTPLGIASGTEAIGELVANLPKYRPTSTPFLAWLYRIAHNLVIDHYRKEENKRDLHLDQVDQLLVDTNNPAKTTEEKLFFDQVKVALMELNQTRQEVIILRFLMGLSLQEVAATLGKSVGAVKVAQHRGLKELRGVLQHEVSED
jgi:RNA polymerase sigma-70 factor (ECF subfamily)